VYGFHDKGAPLRPLIKTHPETGRKSIYTGRHAHAIPGLSETESQTLLDKLMEDACRPPRVYKHVWRVGDIVVWDNRCLMHRARPFDTNFPRVMRASRISGEPETESASTFADPLADGFRPTTSNRSSLVE
jgi:alpha-ketoglutarate-dependent taurine dioxygenase